MNNFCTRCGARLKKGKLTIEGIGMYLCHECAASFLEWQKGGN
jgi:DNA-directed RNA polymerase subunit RPC12/RpoP